MRSDIGIGYLIVPTDVNRDKFLSECFAKERFCIYTNHSEFIANVPCLKHVLNDLKFAESGELGSCILYVNVPGQEIPIIVGTLPFQNLSSYRKESDFIFIKDLGDCELGLTGNLILRKLFLSIKSATKKFCKLIIGVSGDDKSELSLESTGYVLIKGDTGIKIKGNNKEIILDKDKILITNTSKQNIKIDDDGFDYKDGLGNKFKLNKDGYILGNINFEKYITEILDFLGNDIILNTSTGPTGPGCMATSSGQKLQQLQQKIKNINKD